LPGKTSIDIIYLVKQHIETAF